MTVDISYTITLHQDHVVTLIEMCRKILIESKHIGYLKDFTADERELAGQIEEMLVGKKERKEVFISANPKTYEDGKD